MSDSEADAATDSDSDTEVVPYRIPKTKPKRRGSEVSDDESEHSGSSESGADSDVNEDEDEDEDGDEFEDANENDDEMFDNEEDFLNNDADDARIEDLSNASDNDNSDDDDDDENYLQKLDASLREDTIQKFHPELLIHNSEEVDALTVVVRDHRGMIVDPMHRTVPFMTKYERARVLGERTRQINEGAQPLVEMEKEIIDGFLIAEEELKQRKLPFIIRRPLANGKSEYWKLADLEII